MNTLRLPSRIHLSLSSSAIPCVPRSTQVCTGWKRENHLPDGVSFPGFDDLKRFVSMKGDVRKWPSICRLLLLQLQGPQGNVHRKNEFCACGQPSKLILDMEDRRDSWPITGDCTALPAASNHEGHCVSLFPASLRHNLLNQPR
jgi:hypothetical protein